MLKPNNPVYNTLIIYIIVISVLLIVRPEAMYNRQNGKFKTFGFGEGQSMLSFPTVAIGSGVMLYGLFLLISRLSYKQVSS